MTVRMEKVKAELAGSGSVMPLPGPARSTADDPAVALDDLVRAVSGVRAALLASVDGFSVARSSSMPDQAAHSAMLAATVGLAHQLAAMGGGSTLRQFVVDHDAGLIVVWPMGSHRVLAVLAARSVEQRHLRAHVQGRAASLIGAPT